ncbi:hypothetical protein CAEBREN_21607 [Caenorhabditis brenneri]|uniref:CUB domain-containing protein n=1 Tax=Caenorhabditis brenneri TaxID=135651 RepID=G0P139_CAEBE|nr:hypothetical protein CAEBREN_21607 [Caenorhabditis brenneri]
MSASLEQLLLLFLLLIFLLKPSDSTSEHECKCVLFNVTSGNFQSPEFPAPLEGVPCLFYHFQAPPDHIIRLTFDVFQMPPRIGVCSSSIMLFDHSLDGLIEFGERSDFEFCGKEISSGRQFFSNGKEAARGFRGSFLAIPKKNFTSDAVEMAECSYRVEKQKAIIYSPQYPYYYPSKVNCTYHIPQRKGFQIVINSIVMDIGRDAILQIFESVEGKFEKRLIEMVTSVQKSIYVSSTSSLLIYFSAGNNGVERAVGFVIELQYSNAVWSQSPEAASECQLNINSENFKEGQLSSDKIGRFTSSSLPTKCQISLQGYPNEKISVKFTHFNLYVPDNKNVTKRCTEVDNLSADVRVGSRLSRIDEWCGKRTPPNLMSSSNLLQLEYNTKHTNGKLWSANYPGLYPRNIYCEYIFHGRNDQVVHIHFEYFDIEGFNQCDETTQSDYILFSNYQTHDRTNRRFCGKTAPKGPILSESNYFRMIFSTNDIFDATGFYAHYQFITQEKSQISRVKLTISTSNRLHSSSFSSIFVILFMIFFML